jgi:chromosomal replication initiation ATPase DnaA
MIEQLGIAAELAARRAKYARYAYVAPQDRVAPVVQPKPTPPARQPPREEVVAEETMALVREVVTSYLNDDEAEAVKVEVAHLNRHLASMDYPGAVRLTVQVIEDVTRIQAIFVEEYNAVMPHTGPAYSIPDLKRPNRTPTYTRARSVCAALCRRYTDASLNNLGKMFGGMDHTSIIHAIRRTPSYMAMHPILAEVHARVVARVEADK